MHMKETAAYSPTETPVSPSRRAGRLAQRVATTSSRQVKLLEEMFMIHSDFRNGLDAQ